MNIGIIGSGFIVDVFVKNSKKIKEFNLYGIWGRHEEKIRRFEGFKLYTTNIDELLNSPKIDVVYVALPNTLHYEYAYKALKAGKHVMLEKPFCMSLKEAKTLINYAKAHKLLLFETIMTKYEPNYIKMKQLANKIGEIKMIDINFSQYSRKYDKFKNGIILPAFDYKLGGGSLGDLGTYSIHYVVGMFGMPKKIEYFPNVIKKVDTSGVLILDYGTFKANLVHAKDCSANSYMVVQGDEGYIKCNSTPSRCATFDFVLNGQKPKTYIEEDSEFAGWLPMYKEFLKLYKTKNYEKCYEYLNETIIVQKILDTARTKIN